LESSEVSYITMYVVENSIVIFNLPLSYPY